MFEDEYRSLFATYFQDIDFEVCSEDDLLIFLHTLETVSPTSAKFEPTTNMQLLTGRHDDVFRAIEAVFNRTDLKNLARTLEHTDWLDILWEIRLDFNDPMRYRKLIHLLEKAFLDQHPALSNVHLDLFFRTLRGHLQHAHTTLTLCEDDDCAWVNGNDGPLGFRVEPREISDDERRRHVASDPWELYFGREEPLTSRPEIADPNPASFFQRATSSLRPIFCRPTDIDVGIQEP